MKENKNDGTENDIDDFWDLELLLPKTEKTVYVSSAPKDTSAPDFEISGEEPSCTGEKIPARDRQSAKSDSGEKHEGDQQPLNFDKWLSERREYEKKRYIYGKKTVNEYVPSNPLIKKVTISADTGTPRMCERFLTDADRLFDREGEFKGNVSFDSYFPQYFQLNEKQLECYIGFRSLLRRGIYPEVDRAYIYLYLYENINLTTRLTPEKRAENICALIKAYPGCDAKLFSDMCNWLCDICLIYNVELPQGIFGDVYNRVLTCANIKEFYLSNETDSGKAFLINTTRYNWEKSRFYPDNRELFDEHINASVQIVLSELSENDPRYSENGTELCTLIHESYFGALCTSAVKRTISLECLCVTRAESVRKTVTELVKYSENCLRLLLGIRPKLSVGGIAVRHREMIKQYYDGIAYKFTPRVRKKHSVSTENSNVPDYEKLYEPDSHGVSLDEAERIEKASWRITERLVSDIENINEADEPSNEPQTEISEIPDVSIAPENEIKTGDVQKKPLILALKALLSGDRKGFADIAKRMTVLPDALADDINSFMFDYIGDTVIELSESGYVLVEDYIPDVKEYVDSLE